jgi:2-oxoglutarate-Fe(II)-dependent oxygenase superfamily protein
MVNIIDDFLKPDFLSGLMLKIKESLSLFVPNRHITNLVIGPDHPWANDLDNVFAPAISVFRQSCPHASEKPITIFRHEYDPQRFKYLIMRRQYGASFRHCDGVRNNYSFWPRQQLTMILYLQFQPIEGGNFIYYENDKAISIEPKHNRLICFPCETEHETSDMKCAASELSGRFAIRAFL